MKLGAIKDSKVIGRVDQSVVFVCHTSALGSNMPKPIAEVN